MMSKRDLGHNRETGRWGILFPDVLVDMKFGEPIEKQSGPASG